MVAEREENVEMTMVRFSVKETVLASGLHSQHIVCCRVIFHP